MTTTPTPSSCPLPASVIHHVSVTRSTLLRLSVFAKLLRLVFPANLPLMSRSSLSARRSSAARLSQFTTEELLHEGNIRRGRRGPLRRAGCRLDYLLSFRLGQPDSGAFLCGLVFDKLAGADTASSHADCSTCSPCVCSTVSPTLSSRWASSWVSFPTSPSAARSFLTTSPGSSSHSTPQGRCAAHGPRRLQGLGHPSPSRIGHPSYSITCYCFSLKHKLNLIHFSIHFNQQLTNNSIVCDKYFFPCFWGPTICPGKKYLSKTAIWTNILSADKVFVQGLYQK